MLEPRKRPSSLRLKKASSASVRDVVNFSLALSNGHAMGNFCMPSGNSKSAFFALRPALPGNP